MTATSPLQGYLQLLVAKAGEGSDPTLYADLVVDSMPEGDVVSLLNAQPSTIEMLIVVCPAVAEHREWFQTLIDTVSQAFAEEGTSETQSLDVAPYPPPIVPG